ncbi:MAG: GNAT family N-acetyltransferase [Spirochaetales bacterium]|nr:GNAT family N-acetyltransferase [Spirochaetales bacterium]
MAQQIRRLKGKKDEDACSRLAQYCFPDEVGWTSRIFPITAEDEAWGLFKDGQLATATISRYYEAYIYGSLEKMSGISLVESHPHMRNQGLVRELLNHIIKEDVKRGMVFSTLRPFKFFFYEKFGYGYSGDTCFFSFSPDNIKELPVEGAMIRFEEKDSQLKDVWNVQDEWVKNYTFGITAKHISLKQMIDELNFRKQHLFLYYRDGTCRGYILLSLITAGQFEMNMQISKMAWTDQDAFRGLMTFIRTHKDQCKEARCVLPADIPLHLVFKNPRILQTVKADHMVRPLNIEYLLKLKLQDNPVKCGEFSFAIEDPIIPHNTGSYIIENNRVIKRSYEEENIIPLHIFSSLLFGSYSLQDAQLAGLIGDDFPENARLLFTKTGSIHLSEFF